MQKVDRKRKAFSIGHTSQCYLYHCSSGESPAKCSVRRRIFVLLFQLCWIETVFTHHQGNPVAMGKRSKIPPPPDWESCEGIAPFKLAEKRYKRYCGKKTDFSDVFDPWEAATSDSAGAAHTSSTSSSCDLKQAAARRDVVVPVPEHDGIFILPGWLSKSEQLSLAHQCLAVYPERPNKTNLLPHMGQVSGIWEGGGKALNDLRWATLGFQYDWTARTYPEDQRGVVPLVRTCLHPTASRCVLGPQEIQAIAEGAVAATRCAARAIQAEAVIVNFYHPTTTLGGHCDDVEPDQVAARGTPSRIALSLPESRLLIPNHGAESTFSIPNCASSTRITPVGGLLKQALCH
eukprot:201966-Rhodomonas_salina.1